MLLERVLAAQTKALRYNDERIVPTLARLGDLNFETQKYTEADKYYVRAYDIAKQYHKGEFAVR